MDQATEDGVWVDYKWFDPVTRDVMPKTSWVVLHDGYIFGAGVYLSDEAETE
jgi:signal transduction histidine kinase